MQQCLLFGQLSLHAASVHWKDHYVCHPGHLYHEHTRAVCRKFVQTPRLLWYIWRCLHCFLRCKGAVVSLYKRCESSSAWPGWTESALLHRIHWPSTWLIEEDCVTGTPLLHYGLCCDPQRLGKHFCGILCSSDRPFSVHKLKAWITTAVKLTYVLLSRNVETKRLWLSTLLPRCWASWMYLREMIPLTASHEVWSASIVLQKNLG